MYNDPSGEIFFFAILTPILGEVLAGVVAGAIVGATSYVLSAVISNNWNWGGFAKSILMGAISGGMNPGIFSSAAGTLYRMGGQAISSILPSWNISIGNFDFNFSPSIAIGKGWGFGANISATFRSGDFAISAGIGVMNYGAHQGSGKSGWEYRKSAMLSYDDGKFGINLGTNLWSGLHEQQTGIIGFRHGDFRMTYENDGSPFAKGIPERVLGDNHDRFRTAAMTIGIGSFQAGFNLFTGERLSSSYEEKRGADLMTMADASIRRILKLGKYDVGYGAMSKYGLAQENGKQYRLGAAYVGWGNYRIGIDSDRYVRHPIQNIGAHNIISPQPVFQVLS
ncbi:polymorphic toxin type 23 domain-containing protein, partial [Riemerella anatipestifer]